MGSGLYAHVVEELGQAIVDGTMPTGQVVYAEQLVEQLGVSRSVVREGLRALGSMGLIEARPQVGTRVLPPDRWDLLNPQVVTWRAQSNASDHQMRELLEFRHGIEPTSAALAAERMSDADRDSLLAAGNDMQAAMEAGDWRTFFNADAQYHRLVLQGSGNAIIAQFADTVQAALHSRGQDSQPWNNELNALSVQRHLDLAHAVCEHNPADAERYARLIIEETLRVYTAH
ncbi:MAG TPA: FCD domain-containing protein [Terrimesophilobacter sp.]|nr:FCD domain-containing protein [Terrimesophilobacter sp.]HRP99112.1 FCD domain-containing protein [Terrimesophilobacter sp.]